MKGLVANKYHNVKVEGAESMKINFCPSCGAQVHGVVRFCSKCGADFTRLTGDKAPNLRGDFRVDIKAFIEDFVESNADLLKDLAARVERGEGFEKGAFFSVEMRGDKPIIKGGDLKDLEKILKGAKLPFPLQMPKGAVNEMEFKEVRAETQEGVGFRKIHVKLPGVASLKDVTINRFEKGLEIIGRSDKTVYFSKVPLPDGFEVKTTNLEGEVLVVEVR